MQGAATQGSHPNYANDIDVLVPELRPGSWEVKQTSESTITTTFKSEICFKTAYTGVATYKVIMEERNIFCSPYNVMVVCDMLVFLGFDNFGIEKVLNDARKKNYAFILIQQFFMYSF